jgi:hypothetical protein
MNDTLVVARDGSLTLTDKTGAVRRGTATAQEVKRLDGMTHGLEFRGLAPSYTSRGADQMTYTVMVPGVGTVSTMDGVPNPRVLKELLEEFNRLMERVR